jgi:hypothetical protein
MFERVGLVGRTLLAGSRHQKRKAREATTRATIQVLGVAVMV